MKRRTSAKEFEGYVRNKWKQGPFVLYVYDRRRLSAEELDRCAELWLLTNNLDDFPGEGEFHIHLSSTTSASVPLN